MFLSRIHFSIFIYSTSTSASFYYDATVYPYFYCYTVIARIHGITMLV